MTGTAIGRPTTSGYERKKRAANGRPYVFY